MFMLLDMYDVQAFFSRYWQNKCFLPEALAAGGQGNTSTRRVLIPSSAGPENTITSSHQSDHTERIKVDVSQHCNNSDQSTTDHMSRYASLHNALSGGSLIPAMKPVATIAVNELRSNPPSLSVALASLTNSPIPQTGFVIIVPPLCEQTGTTGVMSDTAVLIMDRP